MEVKNAGPVIELSFAETVRYTAQGIITKTQLKKQCAIPSGLYLGARRPGEFLDERKIYRGAASWHTNSGNKSEIYT